jgi:hypothetical protein
MRPPDPVVEDALAAAREQLIAFLGGQLHSVGHGIVDLSRLPKNGRRPS